MGFFSDLHRSIKDSWKDVHERFTNFDGKMALNAALGGGLGAHQFAWNASARQWDMIKQWILPDTRRDRETLTNSPTTPRTLIFGRARVAGQMTYAESGGDKNKFLHLVVTHTGHEVDGFEEVYLDDRLIATFGTNAVIEQYDGTQTEASAALIADSAEAARTYTYTGNTINGVARVGGLSDTANLFVGMTVAGEGVPAGTTVTAIGAAYVDLSVNATADGTAVQFTFTGTSPIWTDAHKLLGCAYSYVKFTYDDTLFPSGLPILKVVIRGAKVYDPRTGLTAWSDNSALCAGYYMALPEELGGMGCTEDEIDWDSIATAADICDEMVPKSATDPTLEKRYTCNGTLTLGGTPAMLLNSILSSMAGTPIYREGKWHIYAGAYYPVEPVTIDESWLNGGIQYSIGSNKNERVNTVRGQFLDPTDLWASKDFPVVHSAAYKAEDGGEELSMSMSLNFTTSITTAQRLARIAMERSRRGMRLNYPCNLKAFKIPAHAIVAVNNAQLGLSGATFRVAEWTFSATGGVGLQLRQEDAGIYEWDDDLTVSPTTPAPVVLPTPWTIAPPSGLAINETAITEPGQASRSQVVLSWTGNDATATRYVVQLDGIDYAAAISDTTFTFNNILPGTYTFGVIALNSSNGRSLPATLVHEVTTASLEIPAIALPVYGSGTLTAGTSTSVTSADCTASSAVVLQSTSSAFPPLDCYVSATGAGSFTITHLTAAGTETFDYVIFN